MILSMKILCVADETEPLIYSNQAKRLYADCDLVLSAGDLPIRYYDYIMTILGKDFFYVYGNHNLEHFDEVMRRGGYDPAIEYARTGRSSFMPAFGGNLVDGRVVRDKRTGLIIMGLGGSMLYNYGKSQYTERQMQWRIRRLIPKLIYNKKRYGRYLDILVTHAPALGFGDGEDICHRGFQAFLSFLDAYRPKYMVHGHVHLFDENSNRLFQYHDTKIINVYKSYILDDPELGEDGNG